MFGVVDFCAFVLGTILTAVVPGANTYRVLDFSFKYGIVGGIWSSLGVVLADITFMLAAAFGLASLLTLLPSFFGVLLLIGGLYFLNMSIVVLKNPSPKNHQFVSTDEGKIFNSDLRNKIFTQSYLTCVSNFKAIFFYTLFFPKFIDPTYQPSWFPFFLLCCTVFLVLVIYYAILCFAGIKLFSSETGAKVYKFITIAFGIFIFMLSCKLFFEFYFFISNYFRV